SMAMENMNGQIVNAATGEPMKMKNCHQCHKMRSDAVGNCVTKKGATTCVLKYCPKCLLTRYGEIGEEVGGIIKRLIGRGGVGEEGREGGGGEATETAAILVGNCAEEINDSSAGCSEENAAARTKSVLKEKEEFQLEEVKLPQGIESITVSSVDLHPENAGSVLQFLEFCLTFREALGLRDGQAHLVVREVLSGSQEHSTLTQTIIQLLTLILVDRGDISVGLSATDDRWFTILGNCLAESEVKLDDFPPEMFQKGISEYEEMDSLQKLKLLNFVCDEALGISVMRNFIENPEYVEKKKKAEEKLNAAEAREKQLYQKIKNDFAKAEADNNGVALTIEQRLAIISQMSAESEENQFPVELDDNDLILWNLKSYNEEPTILLQDLGSCSDICPHEKWYSFSSEQKPQVEKYITFKRKKCRLEKKMEKKEKRR
ncbi:hypothetical protein HID58_042553, partial [Brassica napus]